MSRRYPLFRVSSPSGITGSLPIASSSGASLSGNINVPVTGGWQTWTTVTTTVTLTAGQQTLTIDQNNGGCRHATEGAI